MIVKLENLIFKINFIYNISYMDIAKFVLPCSKIFNFLISKFKLNLRVRPISANFHVQQ